jgi:hypothetical protein
MVQIQVLKQLLSNPAIKSLLIILSQELIKTLIIPKIVSFVKLRLDKQLTPVN